MTENRADLLPPPPPPPPPRQISNNFADSLLYFETHLLDFKCVLISPQWVNSLWTSDAMWRWISSASGKNLLPDGAKPLPATTLTYHQRGTLTFTPGQCLFKYLRHQPQSYVGKFHIWNHSHISQRPTKCCTRMSEWPISIIKSTLELPCDLPCVNENNNRERNMKENYLLSAPCLLIDWHHQGISHKI